MTKFIWFLWGSLITMQTMCWNPFKCCWRPQESHKEAPCPVVLTTPTDTPCLLAELPLPIKNKIALYCWINQMRHEAAIQQSQYHIHDHTKGSSSLCRAHACCDQTKLVCFNKYQMSEYGQIYTFAIARNRFLTLESVCKNKRNHFTHNQLVLADNAGQVLTKIGINNQLKRPICLSDDGTKMTIPYYKKSCKGEVLQEFLINQPQPATTVATITQSKDGYRVHAIRELPVYNGWYVELSKVDPITKKNNCIEEIVVRGNRPMPDLQPTNNVDYLSEFFKYRGVCTTLPSQTIACNQTNNPVDTE